MYRVVNGGSLVNQSDDDEEEEEEEEDDEEEEVSLANCHDLPRNWISFYHR